MKNVKNRSMLTSGWQRDLENKHRLKWGSGGGLHYPQVHRDVHAQLHTLIFSNISDTAINRLFNYIRSKNIL